jgi:large subunit ribosomal protein L4e
MKTILSLKLTEEKKAVIRDLNGNVVEEIELPPIFRLSVRKDLIRRAFHSAHTARLQPKGRDPMAGNRRSGESWGIGHSVARVPRLDNGRAVMAPNVRGGRLAHPPRVEKVLHERINKKERIKAILSALSATAVPEFVKARGHKFSTDSLPVIVVDEFEKIEKTSEAKEVLKKLGVWEDVARSKERTRIRAGKGKMRGRRYVEPRSLLIVVSSYDSPVIKAARNLPGVDVATPDNLSILHLAPVGEPGRLTVITRSALEKLSEKYEVITP